MKDDQMKASKSIRIKLIVLGVLFSLFCGLLAYSLWFFAIVGLFFIAITIAILQRFELKTILLLLSPIITYPMLFIPMRRFIDDALFYELGLYFVYCLFVGFGILYVFAFKRVFVSLIETKLRWIGLGLMGVLLVLSFFSYSVVNYCWDVSMAEKGVTQKEVSYCRSFSQYQPTSADLSNDTPETIRDVAFIPPAIVLLGMILFVGFQPRKKDHVKG